MRPMAQVWYDAKMLVTKSMNSHMKCVMRLKKSIDSLQKQCQKFIDKTEEAGKEKSLQFVCGDGCHCSGREPYFFTMLHISQLVTKLSQFLCKMLLKKKAKNRGLVTCMVLVFCQKIHCLVDCIIY